MKKENKTSTIIQLAIDNEAMEILGYNAGDFIQGDYSLIFDKIKDDIKEFVYASIIKTIKEEFNVEPKRSCVNCRNYKNNECKYFKPAFIELFCLSNDYEFYIKKYIRKKDNENRN